MTKLREWFSIPRRSAYYYQGLARRNAAALCRADQYNGRELIVPLMDRRATAQPQQKRSSANLPAESPAGEEADIVFPAADRSVAISSQAAERALV